MQHHAPWIDLVPKNVEDQMLSQNDHCVLVKKEVKLYESGDSREPRTFVMRVGEQLKLSWVITDKQNKVGLWLVLGKSWKGMPSNPRISAKKYKELVDCGALVEC